MPLSTAIPGLLLLVVVGSTHGLDNGLAKLPPMGYNTWYDVTGAFDEDLLLKTVDAHMELELPKYGEKIVFRPEL